MVPCRHNYHQNSVISIRCLYIYDGRLTSLELNLRRAAEDDNCGVPDWPSRLHIIQGICEGLLYLHEHCRIIHRDIDPSNILPSDDLIPKISDFGLATLLDQGQSEGKAESFEGTR